MNGQSITAKNWVLATGSSAAVPPIPGLKEIGYITNREIFSLDQLPGSLLVLGAGPIGIEMAQAFNRLGSSVTVVDRAGQILTKEDADMADAVQAVMESEGVKFYLGAAVERASATGEKKSVTLRLGDGASITLAADAVLVAMGRSVNVHDLWLDAAGVAFDRSGITVDARLRTNQKHIFVCQI